jgi:lysozyme
VKLRTASALILWPGVVAMLLIALFLTGLLRCNYLSKDRYPIQGLDISHHQGRVDWKMVERQEFDFVYLKASEGGDWVDPAFSTNWRMARHTRMKTGAYHFYRLNRTGIQQAGNFIRTVPVDETALPPVVDLEEANTWGKPKEQVLSEVGDYLTLVHAWYGKKPVIYTTAEFYEAYLKHRFPGTRIWIRNILRLPGLPDGKAWTLWQFANRAHVEGIATQVDLNAFRGDSTAFRRFCTQ